MEGYFVGVATISGGLIAGIVASAAFFGMTGLLVSFIVAIGIGLGANWLHQRQAQ